MCLCDLLLLLLLPASMCAAVYNLTSTTVLMCTSFLQIHWFSIFNSFMMVIFLTGLVAMILLRTLRNDYAKYTRDDDDIESLEHDISEESGWKLVHGDVFRPPPNLALLAALLGTGVQLALLILSVILITIAGRPSSAVHRQVPCTSVQHTEWPCYGQDQQSTVAVMFASEADWAVACCVYFCLHSNVCTALCCHNVQLCWH